MKDVLTLSDYDLIDLERSVKREIARRIQKATGVDPVGEIRGQEIAKRALLVAATGEHSILFYGPAGCGKTMLRAAGLALGAPTSAECRKIDASAPPTEITVEVSALPEREMSGSVTGTTSADMHYQRNHAAASSDMTLCEECRNLIRSAVTELEATAENRADILAVARTIANLAVSRTIGPSHLVEAINYYMPRRLSLLTQ